MMGRMKRITVALILTLAVTITAMPVQLLSRLTGKSGVVNAAGGIQYTEIGTKSQTKNSDYFPLSLYYNYSFSEQIYTKDERGIRPCQRKRPAFSAPPAGTKIPAGWENARSAARGTPWRKSCPPRRKQLPGSISSGAARAAP